MNVVLLKNFYEYENLSREKLFRAHFVGYWNSDGLLTICKDRFVGSHGKCIGESDLNLYINRFSDDERVSQTEIEKKFY